MKSNCLMDLPIESDSMDDIPRYLFLRDVVGKDRSDSEMIALKSRILENVRVREILSEQWDDGSWGRFHSLSISSNAHFTTEQALQRLYNLGLDRHDPPMAKALSYLESYMKGEIQLRDRREKKHDWDLLSRLFVTTWIRLLDRDNPLIVAESQKWAEVVSAAYRSGKFDRDDYNMAYFAVLKPKKGKTIWGIRNFYPVALLAGFLPSKIEESYLDFLLTNPQGIYYIYEGCLSQCPALDRPKQIMRFLNTHELLSRYGCYREKAGYVTLWLNEIRMSNGLWDFGSKAKDGVSLPFSDSWRKPIDRKIDCTVKALRLLHRIKRSGM